MSTDWITVVSGIPRSGTSMMMNMLVAGGLEALQDHIREPDEDNPRGYFELERVKTLKDDASWVGEASGKVIKVVHVHVRDLPTEGFRYRVVLMRREMKEILHSQKTMLERRGKEGGKLSDDRVAAIYGKQLADLKAWMDGEDAFTWMEASYNEILSGPEVTIDALNSFLGGELDTGEMRRVVDPRLYRS